MEIQLPGTRQEFVLRHRYEVLSTVNDLLIAVWFLVGSVLFLNEATTYAGTWLFIVGSGQLAMRPTIRLSRRVHLQRHRAAHGLSGSAESDQDF